MASVTGGSSKKPQTLVAMVLEVVLFEGDGEGNAHGEIREHPEQPVLASSNSGGHQMYGQGQAVKRCCLELYHLLS